MSLCSCRGWSVWGSERRKCKMLCWPMPPPNMNLWVQHWFKHFPATRCRLLFGSCAQFQYVEINIIFIYLSQTIACNLSPVLWRLFDCLNDFTLCLLVSLALNRRVAVCLHVVTYCTRWRIKMDHFILMPTSCSTFSAPLYMYFHNLWLIELTSAWTLVVLCEILGEGVAPTVATISALHIVPSK